MLPSSKPLRLLLVAGLATLSAPSLAAEQTATDAEGRVYGSPAPVALPAMPAPTNAPAPYPGYDPVAFENAKEDWLYECRRRIGGKRKGGLTGGVIGGVVGGIAGSAIAGRGNRTAGAVIGGVAGAAAGAAIGSAADRRKARETMDYCESYLEDHFARQQSYGGYGYAAGYNPGYHGYAAQPVMMVMMPVGAVPIAAAPAVVPMTPQRNCTETTVIEEWVPVTTRKRYIAPRRHVVPDKRVRAN